MKRIQLVGVAVATLLISCTATQINQTLGALSSTGTQGNSLTNTEVIAGLKEALTNGATSSATNLSKVNGFLNNPLIKIPFPEEAIKVKNTVEKLGMSNQVNKFVSTLNHAAEEATKEAAPIFVNAIKNMSIADGFAILKGGENAATNYLKEKTTSQLLQAFQPKVHNAIEKVEVTKYWKPLITKYNATNFITGGEDINPDLDAYVTQKAIDGLFVSVASEETKIRTDPVARTSQLLKKVFGSLD